MFNAPRQWDLVGCQPVQGRIKIIDGDGEEREFDPDAGPWLVPGSRAGSPGLSHPDQNEAYQRGALPGVARSRFYRSGQPVGHPQPRD